MRALVPLSHRKTVDPIIVEILEMRSEDSRELHLISSGIDRVTLSVVNRDGSDKILIEFYDWHGDKYRFILGERRPGNVGLVW